MAGKKQLRPVSPDERPDPLSVSEAAERGTRVDELRAMRRIIAAHLDSPNTLARDVAALSRRQVEISKEIETLETLEAEKRAAEGVDDDGGSTDSEWKLSAI